MVWLHWGLFNHHLFKDISVVSFLGCYEQTLMKICVWVFVWSWLFSSLAQRPKCAITGSYGSSSFDQTTIRKKPKPPFRVYTPCYIHTSSLLTSSPYTLWVLLLILLVILEPREIKSLTVSIVFPSTCHEVMGPDAMILVF